MSIKMKTPSVKMKDSGIDWIGEIPEHWEIVKISNIFSTRNTKVSDEDYPALSVTKNGILPQLENVAKSDAHDNRKLVLKGDFAINSRSDRRGSCGMSDYDGSVSLIITVLKPENNIVTNYYHHLFRNPQFSDEFYRNGRGIVDDLWTTGWQNMKGIQMPYPPIEEQRLIAATLNQICGTLDNTNADIEKQIETLNEYKKSLITEAVTKGLDKNVEMKDSGIDWIGEIPEHWDFGKVKYFCRTRNQKYNKVMGELTYIALENIESWNNKFIETDSNYSLEDTNICCNGDIIFGKLRPYLAKVLQINKTSCCSTEFAVFYNFKGITGYFKYLFTTNIFICEVNNSTSGVKMPRASTDFINNMYIPIPPINEQQEIVTYLDSKCSEIDSIIETKKQQLELLEEYKKSIIYEYVTGKREVTASLDKVTALLAEVSAKPDFAVAQNTQSVSIE